MRVEGLGTFNGVPVVVLVDEHRARFVPITLSRKENYAYLYATFMAGEKCQRPSGPELIAVTVDALDADVLQVVLTGVEQNGNIRSEAEVECWNGERVWVEGPTHDNLCLAILYEAPIHMCDEFYEQGTLPWPEHEQEAPDLDDVKLSEFKKFIGGDGPTQSTNG